MDIGFTLMLKEELNKQLDFAQQLNFEYVELPFYYAEYEFMEKEDREILLDKLNERSLYATIHAPFGLMLSSTNPIIKKAMDFSFVDLCNKAKQLKAKYIVLHPGLTEQTSFDRTYPFFSKSLETFYKIAKEKQIDLLIENMDKSQILLWKKEEEILKTIDEYPYVKINYDVGHANTIADPIALYEKIEKNVVALHLHDNHGNKDEHLALGEGNIDWKNLFKKLEKNVNLTIENNSLNDVKKSKEFIDSLKG